MKIYLKEFMKELKNLKLKNIKELKIKYIKILENTHCSKYQMV